MRGPVILRVDDFLDVLESDFVGRYRNVQPEQEAGTNKMYCKHLMLKEDGDLQLRGTSAPQGVVLALSEQAIMEAATTASDKPTVQCSAFIEKQKDPEKPGEVKICYHCNGRVCNRCGFPLRTKSDEHDCVPPEELTLWKIINVIMKNSILGTDYVRSTARPPSAETRRGVCLRHRLIYPSKYAPRIDASTISSLRKAVMR